MLHHNSAIKISSNWHGGQWSALYQFASSGKYLIQNHLQYLKEIEEDLHPEYALYPSELSKKDKGNLIGLKWYFIRMGERNGIKTKYHKHTLYGYEIPFITEDTPNELSKNVKCLSYLN